MTIGEKIKYCRKQIGITQDKLAELTGIHPVSIRKYETNKMQPQPPQLEKIAAALVTGGSGAGDDGSKALSLIVAHMSAIQNAHTPEAVGLGNVRNYAMASYQDALENLDQKEEVFYYLCPVCGNIEKSRPDKCSICGVQGDKFIKY